MARKLTPTVAKARHAAGTMGAKRAVVIVFDGAGNHAVTSCGDTPDARAAMVRLREAIDAGLADGTLLGVG